MSAPIILPAASVVGTHRQHAIVGLTTEEVAVALKLAPNVEDDVTRVVSSWAFTVDGEACAVWDYRGSHLRREFSAWGPASALRKVFGHALWADQAMPLTVRPRPARGPINLSAWRETS